MSTNAASIPETALEAPLDTKVTVASGVTVKDRVNGTTLTLDASGNLTIPGAITHAGSTNTGSISAVNGTFSGYIARSAAGAITAGTTQTQGGATAMTADINRISVCANANDGVKLPAAVVGRIVDVINDGAQTLKVYPAGSDDLGAGASTATTQATTVANRYLCYATAKWRKI